MSRAPWLGRSTGRHAAPARGRNRAGAGPGPGVEAGSGVEAAPHETARTEAPPSRAPAPPDSAYLLGSPTMADAPAAPLVSPVTEAARAAVAESAASLPPYIPPGTAPLITIDALGRKCPIPIILLAQQIGDVPVGSVIAVLADDPAAYSDIPAWCGLKSHDCVFRVDYATGWSFGVRRRY
ncbi:MAG: sulfurtransferase TusA family protein [Trebonia sp.]